MVRKDRILASEKQGLVQFQLLYVNSGDGVIVNIECQPDWATGSPSICAYVPGHDSLCSPMGLSPSGSSVHEILQARILEWIAKPSSRKERKKESEVAPSCLTLCEPVDCSLPGSSIHGIFQARILEWVTTSLSRRSSWPRDWTLGLRHCRQMLYRLSQQGSSPPEDLPNPGIESAPRFEPFCPIHAGPSIDLMRASYIREGNLLYLVYIFKC